MNKEILSNLIITKIHSVSTMYTEKGTGSKRKKRPLWALVIKYEGETRYKSNGKEYISNINIIPQNKENAQYYLDFFDSLRESFNLSRQQKTISAF